MSSGTVKLTYVLEESVRHLCQILTKCGFRQSIFVKAHSTKFHENMSVGGLADTCGQKDGYET